MTLRRRARGQAMVECAIAVALLAVFPVVMLSFAQWHDIQWRAVAAARFAAFESAWSAGRVPAQDLRARTAALFFAAPGWRSVSGNEAVLEPARDLSLETREAPPPGRAAAIILFLLEPLRAFAGLLGNSFDITSQGYRRAAIDLRIQNDAALPAPLDALDLRLHEHFAVLDDTWNAAGPDHVKSRVAGLVPTTLLGDAQRVLRPVQGLATVLEPALQDLCFGAFDPELLPPDRLGPARLRAQVAPSSC